MGDYSMITSSYIKAGKLCFRNLEGRTGPKRKSIRERFVRNFIIPENRSSCWLWHGDKTSDGYGRFTISSYLGISQRMSAHRYSYIFHTMDEPPKGMLICHKCDVKLCVNPNHLFIGSYKDNVDDMDRKGRRVTGGAKGERNRGCKITSELVLKIREDYKITGRSQQYLADKYGLGQTQVSRIVRRESWKHLHG